MGVERMTKEEKLAELARRAEKRTALREQERQFHERQDRYRFINYEIGDIQLTIRLFTFKLMIIPYSQILDIEVASILVMRPSEINLSNGVGEMCRIKRSRGWFRYVIISLREPKVLLNAFYAFRSLTDPVTEMTERDAPLPPFLRANDEPE